MLGIICPVLVFIMVVSGFLTILTYRNYSKTFFVSLAIFIGLIAFFSYVELPSHTKVVEQKTGLVLDRIPDGRDIYYKIEDFGWLQSTDLISVGDTVQVTRWANWRTQWIEVKIVQ